MMPSPARAPSRRELVLVGGGHTHVQVLRALAMNPLAGLHVTVVLDRPVAVYSGMVPGFIAGQYSPHELEIDVVPLLRRAGARVVLSPAIGLDPGRRRVLLRDRPEIPYDVVSFDVGSTVAGLELPGVREWAIPARPIQDLVDRFPEVLDRARAHPRSAPFHLVVVGGGAGGVEVAFAAERRLRDLFGVERRILLLEGGVHLLHGYPDGLVRRVRAAAAKRGIDIVCDCRVHEVRQSSLLLSDGTELPQDALFWVTGATAHDLFHRSGLPTDERGFVRARSTLQLEELDDVFAVGDCVSLIDYPETPKAGVYAVRQGPPLIHNLRAVLTGGTLRAYRPQTDFLTLLNLGDGTALGAKWGRSFGGSWVFRLKDRIDRRFIRRFQVLLPDGGLTPAFATLPSMAADDDMLCGGCAAKVGRSTLARALHRLSTLDREPEDPDVVLGLAEADDVAAFRLSSGDLLVSSVDAFRAFTDDPFVVGEVAAVNAASDLHAKAVRPRYAEALVTIPQGLHEEDGEELLFNVLAGARAAFRRAGIRLLGGHSTTGADLMVGFSVMGLAAVGASPLLLAGLRPGQALVLTKALGTGVILQADMRGLAAGPWLEAALASMRQSNRDAAEIARRLGATGATDVTGFGLAGHLVEMARRSGVAVEVLLARLPVLPGALELLAQGLRSTFHAENTRARQLMRIELEGPRTELVFDPQTSGGLLFGVPASRAEEAREALLERDYAAAVIGTVTTAAHGGASLSLVAP